MTKKVKKPKRKPAPEPFGDRPVVRAYTKAEFPYKPEEGYDG